MVTRVEYKCVPKDKGEGRAEYSRVEREMGLFLAARTWVV